MPTISDLLTLLTVNNNAPTSSRFDAWNKGGSGIDYQKYFNEMKNPAKPRSYFDLMNTERTPDTPVEPQTQVPPGFSSMDSGRTSSGEWWKQKDSGQSDVTWGNQAGIMALSELFKRIMGQANQNNLQGLDYFKYNADKGSEPGPSAVQQIMQMVSRPQTPSVPLEQQTPAWKPTKMQVDSAYRRR